MAALEAVRSMHAFWTEAWAAPLAGLPDTRKTAEYRGLFRRVNMSSDGGGIKMDVLKGEEGKRVASGARHFRPTSGERLRGQGVSVIISDIFHVSRLYQCNPLVS